MGFDRHTHFEKDIDCQDPVRAVRVSKSSVGFGLSNTAWFTILFRSLKLNVLFLWFGFDSSFDFLACSLSLVFVCSCLMCIQCVVVFWLQFVFSFPLFCEVVGCVLRIFQISFG